MPTPPSCRQPPRLARQIPLLAALLLACTATAASAAGEPPAADCLRVEDPEKRLACYDLALGRTLPVTPAAVPAGAKAPPSPPLGLTAGSPSLLTAAWELTPAAKRGTFSLRPYMPNYILPLHYSTRANETPSTPTHPATPGVDFRKANVKFQISLRAKVAEDFLLPDADLWFAYTQRSMWQLFDPDRSSPFRNNDYEPQAIYVIPTPAAIASLPGGWMWRMTQLGIAHQSNGQADPLSRSWNRVYASVAFENGPWSVTARGNNRLKDRADDNPELTRYIGNTELTVNWIPSLATTSFTWRTHPKALGKGSVQLDWTYPVSKDHLDGLRWYVQAFHGYGETLLDYNFRQTSLGFGIALFRP